MIDPATGTGTFLVEWLRRARTSFSRAQPDGDWPARLRDFVLPSMHAFELMLGPVRHRAPQGRARDPQPGRRRCTRRDPPHRHAGASSTRRRRFDTMTRSGRRRGRARSGAQAARALHGVHRQSALRPRAEDARTTAASGKVASSATASRASTRCSTTSSSRCAPRASASTSRTSTTTTSTSGAGPRGRPPQRVAGPGVIAFISASSYLDGVSMGGLRAHLRARVRRAVDRRPRRRQPRRPTGGERLRHPHTRRDRDRRPHDRWPMSVRSATRACTGPCREVRLALRRPDSTRSRGRRSRHRTRPLVPGPTSDYRTWPEITDLLPVDFPGVDSRADMGDRAVTSRVWSAGVQELLDAPADQERKRSFKDSPTGRKVDDRLGSDQHAWPMGCARSRT